mgnify:CR=1 FL=1
MYENVAACLDDNLISSEASNNLEEDFSKITANSLFSKSPALTFPKLTIASETKAVSLSLL